MTATSSAEHTATPELTEPTAPARPPLKRVFSLLSFKNISAIYVFVVLFVVFSLWVPETFLQAQTWSAMLDSQAVTAVVAVGLVVALSAGTFDLAVGATVGLGSIASAWLLVNAGLPEWMALLLGVGVGLLVGLTNGLLVVKARIDSFIATLGMSSILLAIIAWVSSGQQILGLPRSVVDVGLTKVFGITLPVLVMLAVAIVVWYVLEKTPVGRRVHATGGNLEAARLAGINVSLVIISALAVCGAICALGGVMIASRLGTGDPTVGPSYLLPAFSAAFLGSTQFKGGRFNVWGTVVAVYVLATGVLGLQLAGAPVWIPELFNGVALVVAVGLARWQGRVGRQSALSRLLRRRPTAG